MTDATSARRLTLDVNCVMRLSTLPAAARFQVLSRRDRALRERLRDEKVALLRSLCQDRVPLDALRSLFDLVCRDFAAAKR